MVKVKVGNNEVDFEAVVNLMDDEIRERLHDELAPCKEQDFADAYAEAHKAKYGSDFVVA